MKQSVCYRKLDELRACYQERYTAFCGETAGKTMGGFIESVITDPYYLGYEFKPDCSLHLDTDPLSTGAISPPSVTPRPTPRAKKKKHKKRRKRRSSLLA